MIDITGQAYLLEPGKTYLLVYNPNKVNPLEVEYLRLYARESDNISLLSLASTDPDAVRIVPVSDPPSTPNM